MLDGRRGLVIGDNTDIGEYVKIWSLEHDINNESHCVVGSKTIIGDHVWVAPWSIIMPGVHIKRGAVVAGGAVVTKDIPEKAIVGGVPAKVIGHRNNDLSYEITFRYYL
jgi:maltose O-acetyltransferase